MLVLNASNSTIQPSKIEMKYMKTLITILTLAMIFPLMAEQKEVSKDACAKCDAELRQEIVGLKKRIIQIEARFAVIHKRLGVVEAKAEDSVIVVGEVITPGMVPVPIKNGKIDILTAIAKSGGFSRKANQKEALLQRKKANRPVQAIIVSLKNIRQGKAPMVFMFPGDILTIKKARF